MRKKMGRPSGKSEAVTFSVSMPKILALALKRKARSLGVSRNALIRLVLGAGLYKEKKDDEMIDLTEVAD